MIHHLRMPSDTCGLVPGKTLLSESEAAACEPPGEYKKTITLQDGKLAYLLHDGRVQLFWPVGTLYQEFPNIDGIRAFVQYTTRKLDDLKTVVRLFSERQT